MSTLFSPQDIWIGPIITQFNSIITNQVSGVARIYTVEPDGDLEDNAAIIPEPTWEIKGNTNAKLYLCIHFGIRHVISRGPDTEDSFPAARAFLYPYVMALSTWANQSLSGDAIQVDIKKGGLGQFAHAGIVYTALLLQVDVLTEFNIALS